MIEVFDYATRSARIEVPISQLSKDQAHPFKVVLPNQVPTKANDPVSKTSTAKPANGEKLPAAMTYSGKVRRCGYGQAHRSRDRGHSPIDLPRGRRPDAAAGHDEAPHRGRWDVHIHDSAGAGRPADALPCGFGGFPSALCQGQCRGLRAEPDSRDDEKLGQRPFFEKLTLIVSGEEISGTVFTPDGKPAAGVAVLAKSNGANGRYGWLPSFGQTVTDAC